MFTKSNLLELVLYVIIGQFMLSQLHFFRVLEDSAAGLPLCQCETSFLIVCDIQKALYLYSVF